MTSTAPGGWRSFDELRRANIAIGQYWFDRDTIAYWRTRVESGFIAGHWFVTSDDPGGDERVYRARYADDTGRVTTIGDPYRTAGDARCRARRAAGRGETGA